MLLLEDQIKTTKQSILKLARSFGLAAWCKNPSTVTITRNSIDGVWGTFNRERFANEPQNCIAELDEVVESVK